MSFPALVASTLTCIVLLTAGSRRLAQRGDFGAADVAVLGRHVR